MLYFFILAPIFLACLLLFLPQRFVRYFALLIYASMFAFSIYFFIKTRFYGDILTVTTGDNAILGVTLYCDLTASIFLILTCFLFLCFFFYSFIRDKALTKMDFFITMLQSLILLIVLSRDLFNIFICVEVATIICSILIMFKKESRSIYDGLVYLLINNIGMLFFLLGIGILYRQFGVLDITALGNVMATASAKQVLLPYAFIMTGVALKCAIVPVYMWLPHAHGTPGAPTVVSAVLSGLYVKGGIYLFIRMRTMFMPAINMDMFFVVLGIITAVLGVVLAIRQKDIKLILAYHTISQIGLIIFGLCLNNPYSTAGSMLHIINHALFKSLLFLASGILISKYKTRNVREIRGVFKTYPVIGFAIIAGIMGITGAPLFNGSISKYFMHSGINVLWIEIMFIIINFGTILSFVKYGQVLFGEKRKALTKNDIFSNITLILLSSLCLLTGILGSQFIFLLFGILLPIDFLGYLSKILIWIVCFAAAWFVYKRFITKMNFNNDIGLGFNAISSGVVLLFTTIIIIGMFFL